MAPKKKNVLTLTMQFDLSSGSNVFAQFCLALAAGGFEQPVRQMAKELDAEMRRIASRKKRQTREVAR